MKLYKLRNGVNVIAKQDGNTYQYISRDQASDMAKKLNATVYRIPGALPFYLKPK